MPFTEALRLVGETVEPRRARALRRELDTVSAVAGGAVEGVPEAGLTLRRAGLTEFADAVVEEPDRAGAVLGEDAVPATADQAGEPILVALRTLEGTVQAGRGGFREIGPPDAGVLAALES